MAGPGPGCINLAPGTILTTYAGFHGSDAVGPRSGDSHNRAVKAAGVQVHENPGFIRTHP